MSSGSDSSDRGLGSHGGCIGSGCSTAGGGRIDNGVERLAVQSVTYGPARAKPARPKSDESKSANLVLARTPVGVEASVSASLDTISHGRESVAPVRAFGLGRAGPAGGPEPAADSMM